MNTNTNLRRASSIFRFVTIIAMLIMNVGRIFPISQVHAETTTIYIRDDGTGGDCMMIGDWNPIDKTCLLNADLNSISIIIDSDNVILDGASHVLTGEGLASSYGVSVNNYTGITLRNLIITNYDVGIYVSYANNTLIENTTSHHNKHTGIQVSYSSQSLLRNNLVYGHPGTNVGKGINLSGGGQNVLENNIIRDNSEGLRTGYTTYNIIRNNTFSGQSSYPGGGIMLFSGSHYNTLTGNNFVNNYWGIDIHDSSNQNTIEGNIFSNNSKAIEMTWSVRNLISANTMSNNYTGIDLGVRAGENTIRNNSVSGGTFGIMLGSSGWPATNGSYSNVVTENTVSGASFANIHIDRTNNNQIFRNNFIGSTAHNNDGIGTTFDAGPELGGNYWTAYDTPVEGCINTNGNAYCDSPYLLEAGYQDHYPWTRQDGWLNQHPVADAGGPYAGFAGEPIAFDASASSDPDADPLTYEWDLDNDGEYDDAAGVTIMTSFGQAGEHTVGLRVMDSLGLEDTDTATVNVSGYASNARVSIRPPNQVRGDGWTLGENVTLTIDDPSNGPGVDYSAVNTVIVANWDPNQTMVDFDMPPGFEIKPGSVATLTDGVVNRTTTAVLLTLEEIDVNADIVSGTADPEAIVVVWTEDAMRTVTTGQDGNWTADFSIPGGAPWEQNTFDILPGMFFMAWITDEDGNDTTVWGDTPFPTFSAVPEEDYINGHNWPQGAPLQIEIDDPATPVNPDFIGQATDWEPNVSAFRMIDFSGQYDMKPDDIVTVTNGTITKTHVVTEFSITGIDINTDIVSGRAETDNEIVSWICDDYGCAERYAIANQDGIWSVNFSVLGNDPADWGTYDFKPGTGVEASQADEDGDKTVVGLGLPNPRIVARFHENEVHGYEWPLGHSVTLTIDDPDNGVGGDYTDTQPVAVLDSDPNQTFVQFRLWENNFELENGQIVTMSDGSTTKTLVVAVPTVTAGNSSTNTVEGIAEPSADIWVDVLDWDDVSGWFVSDVTRHETADADGLWLANFSVPGDEDFESQTFNFNPFQPGEVHVQDEDGDLTSTNWGLGLLMLELESDGDPQQHVYIRYWPGRQPVTLLIDDPATPQNPDYTDFGIMRRSEGGYSRLTIDWTGVFDVRPGFTVTVTDGYIGRSINVPRLAVTGYDLVNDTISGISDPFATIRVPVSHATGPEWVEPSVTADGEGNWVANLRIPSYPDNEIYDLLPGDAAEPQTYEADWDHTVLRDWSIPTWTLKGFYQPVDMNGVYNLVKGGSTVPFKFEIFAGSTELINTTYIKSLTYSQTTCDANAITDAIETTAAGGTSLRYDTTDGQFIYNWKTPSTAGKCYRVTMTTLEGSSLMAYFKLK